MPRGERSRVGDEMVSQNGYRYVRTEKGWKAKHLIVLEKKLGRPLEKNERTRFKDGNRQNLDPNNLECYVIRTSSTEKRRTRLLARIEELQAELDSLDS